jgi:hypothetical protein
MKKPSKPIKNAEPDFPQPSPMELAKLAAMLAPNSPPDEALKKAITLYTEAVLFSRELPTDSDDLIAIFGSERRRMDFLQAGLEAIITADNADVLELDPTKDDDATRRFLAERGFSIKGARHVIDNVHDLLADLPDLPLTPRPDASAVLDGFKRGEKYTIPRWVLELLIKRKTRLRKEARIKSARTKQNQCPGASTEIVCPPPCLSGFGEPSVAAAMLR